MLDFLILELGQLDDQLLSISHRGIRDRSQISWLCHLAKRLFCNFSVLAWVGLDLLCAETLA